MSDALRIVFAGTPEFAATSLKALLAEQRHPVIAVYTQPDRPAGRGRVLMPSPVKQLASAYNLPVQQPPSLKDPEAQATLQAFNPDLMVVVAYGLLLPRAVLEIPRLGCINVHASLLPRWRGAAPIQRALLAGDSITGITLMQMDAGLDTGPMLLCHELGITVDDTTQSLQDRLASLGAETLLEGLEKMAAGRLTPIPQDDSQATYASKIDKHESAIDWQESAQVLDRKIRGYYPKPTAWAKIQRLEMRIHAARVATIPVPGSPGTPLSQAGRLFVATGAGGTLEILSLQLPGKRVISAADFLNAHPDFGKTD